MRLALLAAGLLAMTMPARADWLVGREGKRIEGSVVSQSDGRLVFDSVDFGRLELDAAQVRVEAATKAPVWSADIGAKLAVDRGQLNSIEDAVEVGLKVERRTGRGDLRIATDYKYKRTDDVLRDNDRSASIAYDHLYSTRVFAAGRLQSAIDHTPDGDDVSRSAVLAWGWRLAERPGRYLRVGPALGYLSMQRGAEDFDGPALGLYVRGQAPLFGRVRVESELQYLAAHGENRWGEFELRLRQPLGRRLYLALVWDYLWTELPLETGVGSKWRWVLGWDSQQDAR